MLKRAPVWLLAVALAAGAFAQTAGKPMQPGMQRPKNQIAPADAMANSLKAAREIPWHGSLESALAQARRENKPVFFMHMLGKIDGDT